MLGLSKEVLVTVLVFMEIALAIVDKEVTWETILLCNDDKVIELVSNAAVDAILESDILFVSLLVSKVTVDTTLGSDNILDTMLVSMVTLPVVAKVSTFSPVVEPLVDCGFEPPISDVNTSITHSTKKFLSIVIVNSELTGKMNFKSHFCQKLIFKSAKVHNITKFPDFFLLNFRVCEPVHGSM